MNTSSNFASTFAPYTPPPDDPSNAASSSRSAAARAWFPPHAEQNSYQSGGLPTLGNSYSGAPQGNSSMTGFGNHSEEGPTNQWETRFGMRVDVLAAVAYLLGPITALVLLIFETHNDYVRFHAYQSALSLSPLYFLLMLGEIIGGGPFINTLTMICIALLSVGMAFRAYIDAAQNNLSRFYLPQVGLLADQWVSEE
ncbi:hypothetical protein PNOK_0239100 [Pyrrhoderma noxium]|uniref:Uncharacterized protein n=1 Tax=Pyrrhoderma noxium TaxID=2282107 RepID=A0A286USB2_9AGAM|nr:hypothetical protein PNOK_0239100 [Pyrrhoderma noxium]